MDLAELLRVAPAIILAMTAAGPATASTLGLMYEWDTDASSGPELALVTYPTFDAVIGNMGFV
jgi:hypothetical protein